MHSYSNTNSVQESSLSEKRDNVSGKVLDSFNFFPHRLRGRRE